MEYQNHTGRPWTLTEEIKQRVLDNVHKGLKPTTIAWASRVPERTLARWLKKGCEDLESNEDTIFAQLWREFKFKQSEKIQEWIKSIEGTVPNWQALYKLLEAVGRDDFGADTEQVDRLVKLFDEMSQRINNIENRKFRNINPIVEDEKE